MPSWTDENGYDWFNVLRCRRCFQRFKADESGEIPVHECVGIYTKSESNGIESHYVVQVSQPMIKHKDNVK